MSYPYISVAFRNAACFPNNQTLSFNEKISLITGPNNSGKTFALSEIKNAFNVGTFSDSNANPICLETVLLSMGDVEEVAEQMNLDPQAYQLLVNRELTFPALESSILRTTLFQQDHFGNAKQLLESLSLPIGTQKKIYAEIITRIVESHIDQFRTTLSKTEIRELNTQRIITASSGMAMSFSQNSATELSRFLATNEKGDETILSVTILNALNEILGEESFSEIIPKENNSGAWEITLFDQRRHRTPLSQCGTGLHTIILVLLALYAPQKDPNNHCLFLFDELENNLHPAIVRRLYQHIINFSKNNDAHFVITSHSPIAINVFGQEANSVSLFRINRNPQEHTSSIEKMSAFQEKIQSIEDLGAQASDLFQSNGLIWVEGPSDRIYIKHWLELVDPILKENVHYQFIYYGGRLLAHYTADAQNGFISMLKTNTHSAVIMDSDKKADTDTINETKKRIIEEFKNLPMCSTYVTWGREIENEIPPSVLPNHEPPLGQYEEIDSLAKKILGTETFDKVAFAKTITPNITLENMNGKDATLQSSFIEPLAKLIRRWNGMN